MTIYNNTSTPVSLTDTTAKKTQLRDEATRSEMNQDVAQATDTDESLTTYDQCLAQAHNHHYATSHSTNSQLIDAIHDGTLDANNIHRVTADLQTAGRGQQGRSWQSPIGNVYLSLYYPVQHQQFPLTAPLSGLLSLCVGYHLLQMPIMKVINQKRCEQNLPRIGVKWANDIGYYPSALPTTESAIANQNTHTNLYHRASDNKPLAVLPFSKLSGTLIEPVNKNGQLIGIVIGVGFNVLSAPQLSVENRLTPTQQTSTAHNCQSISLRQLIDTADSVPSMTSMTSILSPSLSLSALAPSSLYQPISSAIVQALWTHQKISNCQHALSLFLQDFADVNLLRNRYVRHSTMHNQVTDNKNFLDEVFNDGYEHKATQISKVMGVNSDGCLQIATDNNKICRLFTGGVELVQ